LDVPANVLGYVPVGFVFGDLGPSRALLAAAVLTIFAETAQLVMEHRDASIVDVLSNIVGAILGIAIASHWKIHRPALAVSRGRSQIAALLAAILIGARMASGDPLNPRGVASPGRLEAYWKLDERGGLAATDSSGHSLDGRFSREPKRVDSVTGRHVQFDGASGYVDLGTPTALRLAASMTISAWIKPASHPVDDAAIVSSHSGNSGYQLDTSIDTGPRTVGF
jgi:hypothetical protein